MITLVIIGVIAAITVPTLINKMQREEVETKLKRFYSVMNQAMLSSKLENGDYSTWEWSLIDSTYEHKKEFFDKYLKKHLKYMKVEQDTEMNRLVVYMVDGSIFSIDGDKDVRYFTRSNKKDNPTWGRNAFWFKIFPGSTNPYYKNKGFETYAYTWNGTIEGAKDPSNNYGCYNPGSERGRHLCSRLIQANSWKIPDDYPWL
ncbi:hypothetical protein IKQ26_10120 [bacterium]|nr:hypothetical protein [bacterium]